MIEEEIKNLIESTQGIVEIAWVQYRERSQSIIRAFEKEKKPPERDIEYLLDGLLDFCFEGRFRALFDEVCVAAKKWYPQLVKDYKKFLKKMHGDS